MARSILCPYCGLTEAHGAERCSGCGGFFDDLSQRVTQQHMGPWFVRDTHHPFRPGCSYETLVKQVQRGKVTPDTVLRGPTTHQFWAHARQVPGIAHLVGFCHACGSTVPRDAKQCPRCAAAFAEPSDRQSLGLNPLDPGVWEEVEKARAAEAAAPQHQPQQRPATHASTARAKTATGSASPASRTPGRTPSKPGGIGAGITLLPDDDEPAPRPVSKPAVTPAPTTPPPLQPAPATPARPSAEAVSWMTTDSAGLAQFDAPAVEPPRSSSLNKLIWAMVALNAVLLLSVIGVIAMRKLNPAPATPTANPAATTTPATHPASDPVTKPAPAEKPTAPASAPSSVTVTPAPAPVTVTPALPLTITPAPAPTTPTPAVVHVPAPAPPAAPPTKSVRSSAPLTIRPTGPGSGRVSFFGITAAEGRATVSPEQLAALNAQVEKASDLMKADKPAEALTLLKNIKAHLPQGVDAHELDNAIAQAQTAVERKKLSAFFGQE